MARFDIDGTKQNLINGINQNLIFLEGQTIQETFLLDRSIKESINEALIKIYSYQSNGLRDRPIKDELNRINVDLEFINGDMLKALTNLFESNRQLILNRINNTLVTTLNEIRGWNQTNLIRATQMMEDCLNRLEAVSLNELLMVKAETNKLTQIKIDRLMGGIQLFYAKKNMKTAKNLNFHWGMNNQFDYLLEKIPKDLIFDIKSKENRFLQVINDILRRNIKLHESIFKEMSAELMKAIKRNMLTNPNFCK